MTLQFGQIERHAVAGVLDRHTFTRDGLSLLVFDFLELSIDHVFVGLAALLPAAARTGARLRATRAGLRAGLSVHLFADLLRYLGERFGLRHDGVLVIGLERFFGGLD